MENIVNKTVATDVFADALLSSLNKIRDGFTLIVIAGSLYVIGFRKSHFSGDLPDENADITFHYQEEDVIIVNKDKVVPMSKDVLIKNNRWNNRFDDGDVLLAFTASCEIYKDLVSANPELKKTKV